MRRAELSQLDVYDVDFERGWLTVREGKGGKDRVVPVGERAVAWLRRYLEEVRPGLIAYPDEKAVFVTATGVRFTPDGLGNRVAKVLAASGVRKRYGSCHIFRHTMATLMLENGADVRYIQEMLGHAKLTTTQVYTRVSIQKLKEIHAATHPSARLRRETSTEWTNTRSKKCSTSRARIYRRGMVPEASSGRRTMDAICASSACAARTR